MTEYHLTYTTDTEIVEIYENEGVAKYRKQYLRDFYNIKAEFSLYYKQ